MLLKVGVVMMIVALALAAGITAMVSLRAGEPTPAEPLAIETKAQENKLEKARKNKPNLGEKLELDDEPTEKLQVEDEPVEKREIRDRPDEKVSQEEAPEKSPPATPPERRREIAEQLPVQAQDWPRPSRTEIAQAARPRYYPPQRDSALTLTVGAI